MWEPVIENCPAVLQFVSGRMTPKWTRCIYTRLVIAVFQAMQQELLEAKYWVMNYASVVEAEFNDEERGNAPPKTEKGR